MWLFEPRTVTPAVTREFLQVYRELLAGETVNFRGSHIAVEDGRLLFDPVQPAGPEGLS